MASVPDLLGLARGVASSFEGVAIEGVAELDETTVGLRMSIPTPGGGRRHIATARLRGDQCAGFVRDLRVHIKSALLGAWSRPPPP